jgi:hypothetical protein
MARYLRLPAILPEEIENMISFEVTKQVPYSREEIISDYKIIGVDNEGGYSDVMLVVLHKDEFSRLSTILNACGIVSSHIRLSSELISACLLNLFPQHFMKEAVCIVDIDADTTEILVVKDMKIEFSRVASAGALSLLKDESAQITTWKEHLAEELKRSMQMYITDKRRPANNISKVLITGSSAVAESFNNYIKGYIDVPSEFINILSSIEMDHGTAEKKVIPPEVSISAVYGAFFVSEGLNLLLEEQRKNQRFQEGIKRLAAISLSVAGIVILLVLLFLVKFYNRSSALAETKKMLKEIGPVLKSTEDKLKRLKVVKQQFSEGSSSLDVLYNLYKLIPSNISLVDFEYDEDSRIVRFRGTATKMSEVFRLATILEESDRFSGVQTRSVSKLQTKEELIDFQIRCNFVTGEAKQ